MHIVFFNRSYYPDREATGQFLTELAEDLASKGEAVSIVCGSSRYVRRKPGLLPLGVEVRNGVRIVRVSSTRLPKGVFLFRLINLGSYFAGCLLAVLFVARPDVVVCQTDPPLLPLVGGLYARLCRARFIFSINDLYPDVAVELGEISSPLWLRLLAFATSFGLRRAELVTVLGEDMKAKVIKKGCPPAKIVVTPHWVDTTLVRPYKEGNAFRREHGFQPSDFIVMYSGNLGLSQRLDEVLGVAADLGGLADLHFVIVGEGARKVRLQGVARQLLLDGKVWFLPRQPMERLGESLSAADLHLVPLAPGVAGSVVPSKVYGIMASATPFLAICDRQSHVARIAEEYQCGLWCPPNSRSKLRERIEFAYKNRDQLDTMGRNGRWAAERVFQRRIATEQFHLLMMSLAQRRGCQDAHMAANK